MATGLSSELRQRLGRAVGRLVAGTDRPPEPMAWNDADPGLIALDSPVRTVHADPAMFVGGVRALLLQTLHPVAMKAVADHSDFESDPLGRLHRTAGFLGATTYGSGSQAKLAVDQVRAVHSRVTGTSTDGTPYRADDPHLLGWVHAVEVDSFLRGFQRYGAARLAADDIDRYIADMAVIGEALGVLEAPRTREELAATLHRYQGELEPSPECRDATRFLFAPALPLAALPFYGLIFATSVTLLPRWARTMLLLPIAPGVDPLLVRPAATVLTRTLRWAMYPSAAGVTTAEDRRCNERRPR